MRKILFVLLACLLLCSCSTEETNEISTVEDLDGKNVGFILGTFQDSYILDRYPDINFNCTYLNTASELLLSLKTGKIDSIILDGPIARSLVASNDDVVNYDIPDSGVDMGFIFSDDANDIRNDFNEYLFEAKTSGLIDVLESKWFDNQVDLNTIDKKEYVPTKGTIKVISNVDTPPFSVVKNGNCEGFCLELFYDFAYKYGYGYEIDVASFDAILAGVESGKYEMGVDAISITDERKGNINFSNPIDAFPTSIVVLKSTLQGSTVYTKTSQLEGKKMGCMTGSIFDSVINTSLHASDIAYYNSRSELIVGLQSGKIESYLADKPTAIAICAANDSIKYIDESLMNVDYGFCFSKNALNIKEQFNHFLKEANEDGRLNKIQGKWIDDDVFEKEMDDYDLTGENGTLKICTSPDAAPFSFLKNNEYIGYEVELINMFASEYGYDIELIETTFDSIVSSVASEKFDIAFSGLNITEERKQSVDFSDPTYSSSVVAVVRSGNSNSKNLLETTKDKFYKTFIEEDRYKIIIEGIATTLIITFASLFFGTFIGFIIYLLFRKLGNWFKKIFDTLSFIVSRLPVVVLLMVLFYIIFAKSNISGKVISIIGFTIIETNSVYGMLKTGVGAIDKGQFEGALALGYNDNQTLFKFVLPQALRIIMPTYRNEIISLIKSSSIVGYVTVQDLTRASDLIRSRTYDAFFPLIVTAVIYFILASILVNVVDKLQKRFLPNEKTNEEILKNIKD